MGALNRFVVVRFRVMRAGEPDGFPITTRIWIRNTLGYPTFWSAVCSIIWSMGQQKLSVSVHESLARFIETYMGEYSIRTKSAVVEKALELLRTQDLERAYAAAARETDPAWDVTLADGLPDDNWV